MAVSDLVLGTMYFGTRTDTAQAYALLDRYVEAGGRTLDTANCYAFWLSETGSGGQSEELLGRWLSEHPGLREELVIASKVGQEPRTPGVFEAPWEGLSAAVIARECDRSRERLGVETLDLYYAHGEDRATGWAESVEAFGALVERGAVRRLGVSNHPVWRVEQARALAEARGLASFTAVQLTTSYLRPRPDVAVPGKDHPYGFATPETEDWLREHPEVEAWAYSPLIQGAYDRPDRPLPQAYEHPGSSARLEVLTRVAAAHDVSRSAVVLAWLLASDPAWRPIVGVSSTEQLEVALRAAELELEPEELAALDAAG